MLLHALVEFLPAGVARAVPIDERHAFDGVELGQRAGLVELRQGLDYLLRSSIALQSDGPSRRCHRKSRTADVVTSVALEVERDRELGAPFEADGRFELQHGRVVLAE